VRTVAEVVRLSTDYLGERGLATPRLDAELLVGHALGLARIDLYVHHDRPLSEDELAACRALLARRAQREPVAYILGEWGFRGLRLAVDRRVLVPRPETELLAGRAIEIVVARDAVDRGRRAGDDRGVVRVGEGRHHGVGGADEAVLAQSREGGQDAARDAVLEIGGIEAVDADHHGRPTRQPVGAAIQANLFRHARRRSIIPVSGRPNRAGSCTEAAPAHSA